MMIFIKLFLNSKLDLVRIFKFVKQLFIIQIKKKSRKVFLWNQIKSRMEAYYSELVLVGMRWIMHHAWIEFIKGVNHKINLSWGINLHILSLEFGTSNNLGLRSGSDCRVMMVRKNCLQQKIDYCKHNCQFDVLRSCTGCVSAKWQI